MISVSSTLRLSREFVDFCFSESLDEGAWLDEELCLIGGNACHGSRKICMLASMSAIFGSVEGEEDDR